jgi:hypothetical protein
MNDFKITKQAIAELMALRKLPNCPNMFSVKEVFELAVAHDFLKLADWVFSDTKSYSNFILTGKREV